MILPINNDKIDYVWKDIRDFVSLVTIRTEGRYEPEDILEAIKSRDMQCYAIIDDTELLGIMTTEIIVYPRKKFLRCVTLGGKGWDDWGHEVVGFLDSAAIGANCDGVEVMGRKGWEKKLAQDGYKPSGVKYTKEL